MLDSRVLQLLQDNAAAEQIQDTRMMKSIAGLERQWREAEV